MNSQAPCGAMVLSMLLLSALYDAHNGGRNDPYSMYDTEMGACPVPACQSFVRPDVVIINKLLGGAGDVLL